jgi:hypothetical protein
MLPEILAGNGPPASGSLRPRIATAACRRIHHNPQKFR